MSIQIKCESCGASLNVEEKHIGKRGRCPKCGSVFTVTTVATEEPARAKGSAPPATERQKEYARSLGIEFDESIDRGSISELISKAVDKRDEEALEQTRQLQNVESEAYDRLRKEVLAEVDQEDPRVSVATPSAMIDALGERGLAGILITFKGEEVDDLLDGEGTIKASVSFTDDYLDEADMRKVIGTMGARFLSQGE